MPNVSVSDQAGQLYSQGLNSFGAGIGGGFAQMAARRDNALANLARSEDPATAGAARDKLRRIGGISAGDELAYLTGNMQALAQTGTVTAEDLDKFMEGNIQAKRAMYSQAAAADTMRREQEMIRAREEIELDYAQRRMDAAARANVESARGAQEIRDKAMSRESRVEQERVRLLAADLLRKGHVTAEEATLARSLPPEEARRFLIGTYQSRTGAGGGATADGFRQVTLPDGSMITVGPDGRPVSTSAIRPPASAWEAGGAPGAAGAAGMPVLPSTLEDLLGEGLR